MGIVDTTFEDAAFPIAQTTSLGLLHGAASVEVKNLTAHAAGDLHSVGARTPWATGDGSPPAILAAQICAVVEAWEWCAEDHIRRPRQLGQKPRRLQLKVKSRVAPQSSHASSA